jgi:hypothetical protein
MNFHNPNYLINLYIVIADKVCWAALLAIIWQIAKRKSIRIDHMEQILLPVRPITGVKYPESLKNALLREFVIKLQFVYTYTGVVDAPIPR